MFWWAYVSWSEMWMFIFCVRVLLMRFSGSCVKTELSGVWDSSCICSQETQLFTWKGAVKCSTHPHMYIYCMDTDGKIHTAFCVVWRININI